MVLFIAHYSRMILSSLVSPKVQLGDKIVLYWRDLGCKTGKRSAVNRKY